MDVIQMFLDVITYYLVDQNYLDLLAVRGSGSFMNSIINSLFIEDLHTSLGKKKGVNGVQVLDISDPHYKYRNLKNIEFAGSSDCTYEDAKRFTTIWGEKVKYSLFKTNCQDFAGALKEYLTSDVCSKTGKPNTLIKKTNELIKKYEKCFLQYF